MKFTISICLLLATLAAAAPSVPSSAATANGAQLAAKDPCELCQGAVQKLKEYRDKVHDKVQKALDIFCGALGPMQDSCQKIVQHASQTVEQALSNPQATCQKVQLCSGTPVQSLFVQPAVAANNNNNNNGASVNTCELCKGAVEKLKEMRAQVVDKVHDALKKACAVLGGEMEQTCDRIVTHISEKVQEALDNPQETCQKVHLCGQAGNQQMLKVPDTCEVCQKAVQKLKEYRDKMHDKVQKALEIFCGALGPMKDSCQKIVQHASQTVEQALSNPQATCQKVQLCSGGNHVQNLFVQRAVAANNNNGASVNTCELCKGAVEKLKEMRAQVVDKVHDALKKACAVLGGEMEQTCDRIVTHISEKVQEALDNPEQTCQKVHLCGQAGNQQMLTMPDTCELCQDALEVVSGVVLSAEGKIKEVLHQACGYLGSMREECESGVDAAAEVVEEALQNPQEACQVVQLCPQGGSTGNNTMPQLQKLHNLVKARRMNMIFGNNYLCMACEMAANAFTMECHQPAFQQSVVNLLTPMCQLKPGSEDEKEKCKDYIGQSLPNLLEKYICAAVAPQFCKAVNWC